MTAVPRTALRRDKYAISHGIVFLGFLTTAIVVRSQDATLRLFYGLIAFGLFYYALTHVLRSNRFVSFGAVIAVGPTLLSLSNPESFLFAVKQGAGFFLGFTILFSYFRLHNYQIRHVVRRYVNVAVIASILGIFQEFFFLVDFRPGYELSWILIGAAPVDTAGSFMRIYSFFTEPGYFAAAISPAGFFALRRLVSKERDVPIAKIEAVLVLSALILTFSTLAYVGLLLSIILQFRRHVFAGIVIFTLAGTLLVNIPTVESRLSGLVVAFQGQADGSENISSLIRYLNFSVAYNLFLDRPIMGVGLGSYESAAKKGLAEMNLDVALIRVLEVMDTQDLNFEDASSLFLRIPAELGVLGVVSLFWFLAKYRVPLDSKVGVYQIGCLVFLIVYGLRTGQYVRFELFYFLALYCAVKKSYDRDILLMEESYVGVRRNRKRQRSVVFPG